MPLSSIPIRVVLEAVAPHTGYAQRQERPDRREHASRVGVAMPVGVRLLPQNNCFIAIAGRWDGNSISWRFFPVRLVLQTPKGAIAHGGRRSGLQKLRTVGDYGRGQD